MGSSLGPQGRWALGMSFVTAVALIWVVASFVVQAVEAAGTTPFLLTYICNSLFILYIPLTEATRGCQSFLKRRLARRALQLPTSPQREVGGQKKPNWHFELWRRKSLPVSYTVIGLASPGRSEPDLEPADNDSLQNGGVHNAAMPGGGHGAPLSEGHSSHSSGHQNLPRITTRGVAQSPDLPPTGASPPKHGASPKRQGMSPDLRPLHHHLVSAVSLPGGRASPRSPGASGFRAVDFSPPEGPVEDRRHSLSHAHRPPALPSTPEQGLWIDTSDGGGPEGHRMPLPSPHRLASDVFSEEDLGGYSEVDMSEHLWHPGMQHQQGGGYCEEHKRAARIGLVIAPLWFMGQYTFNLSLILTTVTSNTILSSCSSLFTFIISVVWLKEPFTFFKLAMIGCVMGGTALVSVADSAPDPQSRNRAPNPILGDALVLLSALLYATYTTMLRKELPDERSEEEEGEAVPEQKVSTALVFGFVGLFGALLLWPILLGLHVTGVERVRKMGGRQFGLIIAKGLLDNVLSDYLWARAVVLTTPTAATVGLAFQTPIAIVADIFINRNSPSVLLLVGGALVTVGFFGINVTPLTSWGNKLDGRALEPGGLELSPDNQRPVEGSRDLADGFEQTRT
ncbi:hypothetical protein KFL_003960080 [Klebsormidium nitens]|uniref:EamA domain-containing protein n=1 Tax=Klebsormidium nitens TaxID=105231 RepID=A0A1Y1IH68_KLENI|nr:hypothetical protein KFL_003960080 [Klebsormidium nitens]|eukprot:GAQ88047.1 hypothetical protein KFL_003960080 [Klebsormidium nitens]